MPFRQHYFWTMQKEKLDYLKRMELMLLVNLRTKGQESPHASKSVKEEVAQQVGVFLLAMEEGGFFGAEEW